MVKGKLSANLPEGQVTLRITINGAYCNIDKIKLICTKNTGIDEVADDEHQPAAIFNLSGQKVDASYRGIIIRNGKKILNRR